MEYLQFSEGLILTFDQDVKVKTAGKSLQAIPVWKWMLTGIGNQ
jgi:predicted AAA+ superfamily ATPase